MFGHELEFNPKGNSLVEQELVASGISHNITWDDVTDVVTGGAASQNKYAKKQADRQNDYNQAVYDFETEELDRQYNYALQGQEIKKINLYRELAFQDESRAQEYNYGMGIRDYQFKQDKRAYNQSVAQATAQKGFNAIASDFANLQQDRNLMEQQIELELSRQETLVNYTAQAYGLQMKKKKLKSGAMSSLRQSNISALKAKGSTAARGQAGRSGAKSLNAIQMEAAAAENDIVNELMSDSSQVDMDLLLSRQENMQDNLALDLSKNNLLAADSLTRQQISLQRAQADLDAEASILLKPQIAPPLPKPIAMPLPDFQQIYKPIQGPPPMKAIPYQANLWTAGFSNALNIASSALNVGSSAVGFYKALQG